MYLFSEDDKASLKKSIEQVLQDCKTVSSLAEITNTFGKFGRVVRVCFTKDENGLLFLVDSTTKLTNGQTMWFKTERMTFPNYFYSDRYLTNQIVAGGFYIDKIENPYTEEKTMIYNFANPRQQLGKTLIDHPPSLLYYLHTCTY